MKFYLVKVARTNEIYRVAASSEAMAMDLIRTKFKIDGRRAMWARQVRGYNFR